MEEDRLLVAIRISREILAYFMYARGDMLHCVLEDWLVFEGKKWSDDKERIGIQLASIVEDWQLIDV